MPKVTFIQHSRAYYGAVDIGDYDQIAIALEDHPDAGEFIIRWESFSSKPSAELVVHNGAWRTLKHLPELLAFLRDEAASKQRPGRDCMMPDDFTAVLRERFGYLDITPEDDPDE